MLKMARDDVLHMDKLPHPMGLNNTGVICYFNSLIQSLVSCTTITEYFIQNRHNDIILKNPLAQVFLKYILKLYRRDNHASLCSSEILRELVKLIREKRTENFGRGQESASEGLVLFIDMLNIPYITALFNHRYESLTGCSNCKEITSTKLDYAVHLELFANVNFTTEKEFSSYILSHTTVLEDYKCDKCNIKGNYKRMYRLRMLPSILVIMFNKYFNKKTVWSPPQIILPHKSGGSMIYKKVSQVEHSGSLTGGHYWAICERQGGVFRLNDLGVTKDVLDSTPSTYMVFYHREKYVD